MEQDIQVRGVKWTTDADMSMVHASVRISQCWSKRRQLMDTKKGTPQSAVQGSKLWTGHECRFSLRSSGGDEDITNERVVERAVQHGEWWNCEASGARRGASELENIEWERYGGTGSQHQYKWMKRRPMTGSCASKLSSCAHDTSDKNDGYIVEIWMQKVQEAECGRESTSFKRRSKRQCRCKKSSKRFVSRFPRIRRTQEGPKRHGTQTNSEWMIQLKWESSSTDDVETEEHVPRLNVERYQLKVKRRELGVLATSQSTQNFHVKYWRSSEVVDDQHSDYAISCKSFWGSASSFVTDQWVCSRKRTGRQFKKIQFGHTCEEHRRTK